MPKRRLERSLIGHGFQGTNSIPVQLNAKPGSSWRIDPASVRPGEPLREEGFDLRRVLNEKLLDDEIRASKVKVNADRRE